MCLAVKRSKHCPGLTQDWLQSLGWLSKQGPAVVCFLKAVAGDLKWVVLSEKEIAGDKDSAR